MSLNMPRTTVAFQGGQYGSYMHWLLYSLLYSAPLKSPFVKSTSHDRSYIDPALIESGIVLDTVHAELSDLSDPKLKLSTIHPVTDFGQDFIQQIKRIGNQVDCVIVPYCDHATYLLGVHNYIYKIPAWPDMWSGPLQYVDRQNLKDGWGVDIDDMTKIPKWILREHHSMNVFDAWESQCRWFAPNRFQQSNIKFVLLHDLFYNFLDCIESIKQHLGVEWVRDPAELLPLHQQNIRNQEHRTQDQIAQRILDSIIAGTDYVWNNTDITLYTEAYIQRRLQQLGYMLKCNELNVFPTSTKQLLEACA